MSKPVIRFHSEQQWSPMSKEILSQAVRQVYPDGARMEPTAPGPGVICFGGKQGTGIRTLSPAQVATAPNAVSAVTQALVLQRDGMQVPELNHVVLDNIEMYAQGLYALTCWYDRPLTVDIEWAADKRMLSLAFTWGEGKQWVFPEEYLQGEYLTAVAQALSLQYFIVGANWKSDAGIIFDHCGVRIPVWFDTMLAHHTMFMAARGQHGLKEMAETMLGVSDWDTGLHEYTGKGDKADFGKAPRDMLYEYNALDVLYTHALYELLLPIVQDNPAFWFETHAANMLIDVEHNRLKIDVPYIEHLAVDLSEDIDEARANLPEDLNPASPKQLLAYFAENGLKLKSTAEKVLLEHQDYAAVQHILAFRKASKLKSTYGESYLKAEENGYLKPGFNVHGTSTGRLSSSKPFNAQNIPRDKRIKRIFVSRWEKADESSSE